jgi:hypothetical protein
VMEMMANTAEVINGKGKQEYSSGVEVGYNVGVSTGKFCSRLCGVPWIEDLFQGQAGRPGALREGLW